MFVINILCLQEETEITLPQFTTLLPPSFLHALFYYSRSIKKPVLTYNQTTQTSRKCPPCLQRYIGKNQPISKILYLPQAQSSTKSMCVSLADHGFVCPFLVTFIQDTCYCSSFNQQHMNHRNRGPDTLFKFIFISEMWRSHS